MTASAFSQSANILALDTSTNWASAGLSVGASGALFERRWHSQQNHCSELTPTIAALCEEGGLAPRQITHIAVALGPGRFSATRAGVAAAIGLSLPRGLPIVGVPTYQIEILPYLNLASAARAVFVALPAGRDELIWRRYADSKNLASADSGLSSPARLADAVGASGLVCGEGAPLLSDYLDEVQLLTVALPSRAPVNLIKLAQTRIAANAVNEYKIEPIYAREPSITLKAPKRAL